MPVDTSRPAPIGRLSAPAGRVAAVALVWLAASASAMAGPSQPAPEVATLSNGQIVRGHLRRSDANLLFQSVRTGRQWSFEHLRSVEFSQARPPTPADRLLLAGRQAIPGTLVSWDPREIQWKLPGGSTVRVSRSLVEGLAWIASARPIPAAPAEPREPAMFGNRRDSAQDCVVLRDGGELYGHLGHLDPSGVELRGIFGSAVLPRHRVAGVWLKRRPIRPAALHGVVVDLRYRSPPHVADSAEPNSVEYRLMGRLVAAGPQTITLAHPGYGTLQLSRDRVDRIETRHVGLMIDLDPRFYHLGNEPRADFDVFATEGSRLEIPFILEALPADEVSLGVTTVGLEGEGPGLRYSEQLASGHLRTNIVINGRTVDYLNRHVRRSGGTIQRLTVAVPKSALVVGRNLLAIDQLPHRDRRDELDDCGLFGFTLQLGRAP